MTEAIIAKLIMIALCCILAICGAFIGSLYRRLKPKKPVNHLSHSRAGLTASRAAKGSFYPQCFVCKACASFHGFSASDSCCLPSGTDINRSAVPLLLKGLAVR